MDESMVYTTDSGGTARSDLLHKMNLHTRERYRAVFTRLDPKRGVHGMNFKENGYIGCRIDHKYTLEWADMQAWCHANYGDRYAWLGDTFWFLDADDAFLFKMTWGSTDG